MSAQFTEVEQKALDMGWIPQDQFKGDPEKWVDADKYVERSEQFIPFIKAENRKLKSELDSLKGDLGSLKSLLGTTTETLEALKKENSEINKLRTEQVRKQLVSELAEARRENDVEKEEELRDQLDEVKAAQKTSSEAPVVKQTTQSTEIDPAVKAAWSDWVNENSWWNTNRGMRALSVDIANELAREGKITTDMLPEDRFRKVGEATQAEWDRLTKQQTRAPTKVEGSRGGSGGEEGSGPRGKAYGDLPPEAKAGCKSFEADIKFGKGRRFENVEAYRQHYANKYFGQ